MDEYSHLPSGTVINDHTRYSGMTAVGCACGEIKHLGLIRNPGVGSNIGGRFHSYQECWKPVLIASRIAPALGWWGAVGKANADRLRDTL